MTLNIYMRWIIVNHDSGRPLNERCYLNESDARQDLVRLGETFSRLYWAVPAFTDPRWGRVLMEGFAVGDLEGILLPQFSVDVYVPGDSSTDNIVVGFLIKGVPEAVFPFKNFCTYSRGVKHVEYGDSDTLPHTSIVYVEYDRAKFHPGEFDELVHDVCRLGRLTPEDFSVNFPNSNKSFPYSVEVIDRYYRRRDEEKNRLAQLAAVHARRKQIQKELDKAMSDDGEVGKHLGPDHHPGHPAQHHKNHHGMHHLKRGGRLAGGRPPAVNRKGAEIDDATKNMIVQDAKRNLTSRSETWEQFDNRWASRLRVTPSRVSTVRKRIYDR